MRILSLLIILFSLSQVSGLIISISQLSKQTISVNQDAEETENVESQETEYDYELQDVFYAATPAKRALNSKYYITWKEKSVQAAQSLPEVPPPDSL